MTQTATQTQTAAPRRIRLVLEALTPVAHGDTRTGIDNPTNIRPFMRQPVLLNGRRAYAPHLSENSLRTALFRVPLADHLVATLGIAPAPPGDGVANGAKNQAGLPRAVLALLYSGGARGGGRAPADELALGHAVGDLYPSLALLGGATDNFILPRSKMKLSAWLVAQEYLSAIEALFPEEAARAAAISAFDLLGDETRTRGTGTAACERMIYSYETLAAGARLAVELTLDRFAAPAAAAAIPLALARWDGFLGGQGRQGRGRAQVAWIAGAPDASAYELHVAEHAGAMRAGLLDGTLGAGKVLCAA